MTKDRLGDEVLRLVATNEGVYSVEEILGMFEPEEHVRVKQSIGRYKNPDVSGKLVEKNGKLYLGTIVDSKQVAPLQTTVEEVKQTQPPVAPTPTPGTAVQPVHLETPRSVRPFGYISEQTITVPDNIKHRKPMKFAFTLTFELEGVVRYGVTNSPEKSTVSWYPPVSGDRVLCIRMGDFKANPNMEFFRVGQLLAVVVPHEKGGFVVRYYSAPLGMDFALSWE